MTQGLSDRGLEIKYLREGELSNLARNLAPEAFDVYSRVEDYRNHKTFKAWQVNVIKLIEGTNRWEISVVVDRLPVIGAILQVVPDIHYGTVVSILCTFQIPENKGRDVRHILTFAKNLAQEVGASAIARTSRVSEGVFKLKYTEV